MKIDSIKCSIAQSNHSEIFSYRYDFEPILAKLIGLKATHSVDICTGLDTWEGPNNIFNRMTSKKRFIQQCMDHLWNFLKQEIQELLMVFDGKNIVRMISSPFFSTINALI